jgi:predicted PurR-regulated permease PerM
MAAFSFSEFYQRNRRIVIWVILFLLLWLLRDFFGLVFLSFVLAIIAAPLAELGTRRLKLPHWLSLSLVYLIFLVVLGSFVRFVVPSVASEVNRMIVNLPTTETRLIEAKNRLLGHYPTLRQPLNGFLRSALTYDAVTVVEFELAAERERLGLSELQISDAAASGTAPRGEYAEYFDRQDQLYLSALMSAQFQRVRDNAPAVINMLYRATATTLLALLFSYLILIDLGRIKAGIGRLKNSRVGDFYEEAAQPIVRLGILLGRAMRAQASIAVVNTVLTLIGLLILDIPLVAMLSVVVFFCSFVPVLGVFISTTPIVLVALHAVEAYFLNPLIYGKYLKLNPVLTLIILYVGYHAFGLWGMLLGVPVARYFIHDVLGVPFRDRSAPLPKQA